jgi:hypothetical protein
MILFHDSWENDTRELAVIVLQIPIDIQFNSIYITFIIVTIVTLEQVISLTIMELPIKFYITIKCTLSTPIKYIMFTI